MQGDLEAKIKLVVQKDFDPGLREVGKVHQENGF